MALYYLDTETTGLDPFTSEVVTVQIMDEEGNAFVITDTADLANLRDFLEQNTIVGVNLKFDAKFLKYHYGITLRDVFDCQLAEILISGGQLAEAKGSSLRDLVKKYCGVELDKSLQTSFIKGQVLTPEQLEYAVDDLRYLPQIMAAQQKQIQKVGLQEVVAIEMKALPAVVWLELSGIHIDMDKLTSIQEKVEVERTRLVEELLQQLDPVTEPAVAIPEPEPEHEPRKKARKPKQMKTPERLNLNSTQQLEKALNKIGVKVKGTSESELSKHMDNPVVKKILEYRKANKFLTTYVRTLPTFVNPVTHHVHASFRQIGAMTGRFASSEPNLQNQVNTPEWRSVFVPGKGNKFVVDDYSQIELRIIAQISQDPAYLRAFQELLDLHQQTADVLPSLALEGDAEAIRKKRRSVGKTTNFALSYGGSAAGLKERIKLDLGIDVTKEQAQEIINNFWRLYRGAEKYFNEISLRGLRELQVRTLSNRLCVFKNPREYAIYIMTARINKEYRTRITKEVKALGKEQKWTAEQVKTEIAARLEQAQLDIEKQIRKEIPYQTKKNSAHVEKESKNAPIQGTGVDILKTALGNLVNRLQEFPVLFVNCVHDEIVLECPEAIADNVATILKEEMEAAGKIYLTDVPCPVETFIVEWWTH